MAKYNQLLRIEEELGDTYFPGKKHLNKIIFIIIFKEPFDLLDGFFFNNTNIINFLFLMLLSLDLVDY
jgi:hypothetical protein